MPVCTGGAESLQHHLELVRADRDAWQREEAVAIGDDLAFEAGVGLCRDDGGSRQDAATRVGDGAGQLRSSLGQGRGGGQQDEQAAVNRSAQEGHAVPPKRADPMGAGRERVSAAKYTAGRVGEPDKARPTRLSACGVDLQQADEKPVCRHSKRKSQNANRVSFLRVDRKLSHFPDSAELRVEERVDEAVHAARSELLHR